MANTSDQLGHMSIVEQADLENLVSYANRKGDTRKGGDAMGKRPGMHVLMRATSDDTLKEVFALGAKSSDGWRTVDGSGTTTPVNLSSWTVGADSTYASGLLTTDGGNDAAGRVSQGPNLKAGTYFVSGTFAGEGTPSVGVLPRIRIGTAAADATYGEFIGSASYMHATAAEDLSPKGEIGFTFTIPVDDQVFFTLDMVDAAAGTLDSGSVFITLNPLEAA